MAARGSRGLVLTRRTEAEPKPSNRSESGETTPSERSIAMTAIGHDSQIYDEVWRKFLRLGQMSSTALAEREDAILIRGGPMSDFTVRGRRTPPPCCRRHQPHRPYRPPGIQRQGVS